MPFLEAGGTLFALISTPTITLTPSPAGSHLPSNSSDVLSNVPAPCDAPTVASRRQCIAASTDHESRLYPTVNVTSAVLKHSQGHLVPMPTKQDRDPARGNLGYYKYIRVAMPAIFLRHIG